MEENCETCRWYAEFEGGCYNDKSSYRGGWPDNPEGGCDKCGGRRKMRPIDAYAANIQLVELYNREDNSTVKNALRNAMQIIANAPTIDQPSAPLTLEELREMDGEPVWIVESPDWGHYELSQDAEDYVRDRDEDFYGMKYNDPCGKFGLHALGWLAYRRKPEEMQK